MYMFYRYFIEHIYVGQIFPICMYERYFIEHMYVWQVFHWEMYVWQVLHMYVWQIFHWEMYVWQVLHMYVWQIFHWVLNLDQCMSIIYTWTSPPPPYTHILISWWSVFFIKTLTCWPPSTQSPPRVSPSPAPPPLPLGGGGGTVILKQFSIDLA